MNRLIVNMANEVRSVTNNKLQIQLKQRRTRLEEETFERWNARFPSYESPAMLKGATIQMSQFIFCTFNRETETFEATAICPFCGHIIRSPLFTEAALTELILVIEDTNNPVPNYKHECTAEPPLKDEIPF